MNAPKNWDSYSDIPCDSLWVCKDSDIYYSYWNFSFLERLKVLFGKPMRLACFGNQVPVSLDVTNDK